MFRFSLASPIALALALSPGLALGQGAPGGSSTTPLPATSAPPALAPPAGSRSAPIDRGQLLEPTPGTRPGVAAPAPVSIEPRETDRTRDVSIGANPREVYVDDWWVRSHPVFEFHGYL